MQELFRKYLRNQCAPEEVKLLLKQFDVGDNKDILRDLIVQQLEAEEEVTAIPERELKNVLAESYQHIRSQINFEKKTEAPVVPLVRRVWFRIAAAVIILAIAGTYLLVNQSSTEQPVSNNQNPANDIAPGGNKASLTLANGSIVDLETVANGKIANEGNAEISKLSDGQIVYNLLNEKPTDVLYNTVSTPRGGQYQLTLADGSKVWLNSASSIRFPATFGENERIVEITGEVYFEVAKNASAPFRINVAGKKEVEVLGTHFNINCYDDEATINTTLIEGSLKVTSLATKKSQLVVPGQRAQLDKEGHISVAQEPDLDKVIAWKNGYFNFNDADTHTVMRVISRWYNVDIAYQGKIPDIKFGGEIEKTLDLSQLLRILEKYGLHFKLEERRLIVTS